MKLNKPKFKILETISNDCVTLTREDTNIHYIDCQLTIGDISELDSLHITNCSLEGLEDIHLTDVILERCMIAGSNFNHISFRRCVFLNCQMTGLNCDTITMKDTLFENSKLQMMNLVDTTFDGVLFKACDMTESYFYHTEILKERWNIEACNISGTTFIETSLAKVNLSQCEIDGITLQPTDLQGATVNSHQAIALLPLFGVQVE